jgi:hypothetical protein
MILGRGCLTSERKKGFWIALENNLREEGGEMKNYLYSSIQKQVVTECHARHGMETNAYRQRLKGFLWRF